MNDKIVFPVVFLLILYLGFRCMVLSSELPQLLGFVWPRYSSLFCQYEFKHNYLYSSALSFWCSICRQSSILIFVHVVILRQV